MAEVKAGRKRGAGAAQGDRSYVEHVGGRELRTRESSTVVKSL